MDEQQWDRVARAVRSLQVAEAAVADRKQKLAELVREAAPAFDRVIVQVAVGQAALIEVTAHDDCRVSVGRTAWVLRKVGEDR